MSGDAKQTPAQRVAAIEARKAARTAVADAAREEQYATDRERIADLEDQLGIEIHISKQVRQHVPGCPVVVGVRAPGEGEYKRFFSQINKSNGNGDAKVSALKMLAEVCWVYPADPEQRKALLSANSALLASVGNFANKLAEVEIADEGKE